LESAVEQAKVAAGDKDVTIIGSARTGQECLRLGLADELHVDIMPVVLGNGLRFFPEDGIEGLQLEILKVVESPGGRTNLRYRILR
jgi:dihydrofolate reductase